MFDVVANNDGMEISRLFYYFVVCNGDFKVVKLKNNCDFNLLTQSLTRVVWFDINSMCMWLSEAAEFAYLFFVL